MATWGELSNFTWGELAEMELTWDYLKEKPIQDIMSIAQEKLDRFKALPPEKRDRWAYAIPLIEAVLAGAAANIASDLILSVDWGSLLVEVLKLLDKFLQ